MTEQIWFPIETAPPTGIIVIRGMHAGSPSYLTIPAGMLRSSWIPGTPQHLIIPWATEWRLHESSPTIEEHHHG